MTTIESIALRLEKAIDEGVSAELHPAECALLLSVLGLDGLPAYSPLRSDDASDFGPPLPVGLPPEAP